jgi:hypothetical protein
VPFLSNKKNALYCTPECKGVAGRRRRGKSSISEYARVRQTRKRRQQRLVAPEPIRVKERARRAGLKLAIAEYKVFKGCKDCGYNKHHAALHFDHVIGEKLGAIGNAKSFKFFHSEAAKCEVVCATCHAIRTYSRSMADRGLNYTEGADGRLEQG